MEPKTTRLLIENIRHLASFDDAGREFENEDILIEGNTVKAIGKDLRGLHALPPDTPTIDGRGHLAIPGMVNCHHHFFQTLTRVLPRVQNAELFEWLVEQYHVFEAIDPEGFYVSALLAISELLLSGCTTTSDHHYLFPVGQPVELIDQDIRAARELGIRLYTTRGSMTLGEDDGGLPPMTVIERDERVLADYERLISGYHDRDDLAMIKVHLAPCSPFNSTEFLFRETAQVARRHGVRIHTHLAETADEDDYCLARYGKRPLDYVAELGWEGSDVWFAHCVMLNEREMDRFARLGTAVAHCPSSNCRLGSGLARIPEMLARGVTIGLGVDGSASNDSGDLLAEARTAFLLHRSNYGVGALTARDVLRMATRGGAAVFGNPRIGRLEPGSAADVVLYNLDSYRFAGGASLDPLAALILTGPHPVSWSIVNGRIVVERGVLCGQSQTQLVQAANRIAEHITVHAEKKRDVNYRENIIWPKKR